jgi:hypothetical protein
VKRFIVWHGAGGTQAATKAAEIAKASEIKAAANAKVEAAANAKAEAAETAVKADAGAEAEALSEAASNAKTMARVPRPMLKKEFEGQEETGVNVEVDKEQEFDDLIDMPAPGTRPKKRPDSKSRRKRNKKCKYCLVSWL